MTRFRLLCVPFALFAAMSTAHAQRRGGYGGHAGATAGGHAAASYGGQPTAVRPASGGAWTGRASKWGGSPVQAPSYARQGAIYGVGTYAYVPPVIAAPAAVPAVVLADTAVTAYDQGPTEMRVVTTAAPRELTTMEVYRQQRFARP
jgi:hypothetical protein